MLNPQKLKKIETEYFSRKEISNVTTAREVSEDGDIQAKKSVPPSKDAPMILPVEISEMKIEA